jgi:hypothetical protein
MQHRFLACLALLVLTVAGGCAYSPRGTVAVRRDASPEQLASIRTFLIRADQDHEINAIARATRGILESRNFTVLLDDGAGTPDAIMTCYYKVTTRQEHSYSPGTATMVNNVYIATPGSTTVETVNDVEIGISFITIEEALRHDGDLRLAKRAWEGTITAKIRGVDFSLNERIPLLVENLLAEFPADSSLPRSRPLDQVLQTAKN